MRCAILFFAVIVFVSTNGLYGYAPDHPASMKSRIAFTENRGQVVDMNGQVRTDILYTAEAGGVKLFFRRDGVSYVFLETERERTGVSEATGEPAFSAARPGRIEPVRIDYYRMDMSFIGSRAQVSVRAESPLPGYDNFYYAHCPDGITEVRSYARIVYENLYENIDLVFIAGSDGTKYEFIVRPEGDPSVIRMRYDGADALEMDADGQLRIRTPLGRIIEQRPYSYQYGKPDVRTEFVLRGRDVTFAVAPYDAARALVIDPWSTYYGGSTGQEARGIAVDAQGNVNACGWTYSIDFPVINAFQGTHAGGADVFVVQFNAAGARNWATYYGGTGGEAAYYVDTDAGGNVLVAGPVGSWDFPVANAVQPTLGAVGADDVFVLKLNSGGAREWATYYGGAARETCGGMAADASGDVILAGGTWSTNFPTQAPWQSSMSGVRDAFVVRFTSAGTVGWASYYGGYQDDASEAVVADGSGNVIVAGITRSTNFPVLKALHATHTNPGSNDMFIMKLDPSGTPVWSTYYGGSAGDEAYDVDVDAGDNIYLAGITTSTDFKVSGAYQPYLGGSNDVVLMKLLPNGSLSWATYFGGSGGEGGWGVEVDNAGDILIAGPTGSANLPVENAWQTKYGGSGDGFIAKFNAIGRCSWATYLGGDDLDRCGSVATDPQGNVCVTGLTYSLNFPLYNAFQSTSIEHVGYAFLASLTSDGILMPLYKPEAPAGLTVKALTPTRVELSWTDRADNESEYIIEWQKENTGWQSAKDTADARVHTLTGLYPETPYSFRVQAANWAYSSEYSNVVQMTMPEFKAPTELKVADVGANDVSLVWQDQSNNETDFIIDAKNGTGEWRAVDTVRENVTSAIVTGLTELTQYSFRVFAQDSIIPSRYSNVAQATTKKFLAAPTNLTARLLTLTSVRLQWEDNSPEEAHYQVFQRVEGGEWEDAVTTDPDETTVDITPLLADTTYHFRVRAVGDDAASGFSNEASVITKLVPSAPRNLVASAEDFQTVNLQWEAGSANEDYFEIERMPDGGSWVHFRWTAKGETAAQDVKRESETVYWYRVRAWNDLGPSLWSNPDSARTYAMPVPGKPFGVSATALDARTIQLLWYLQPPSYEDSCEIQESGTGDEGSFATLTSEIPPGQRTFDRRGLEPLTTYYYRVRASNRSGSSPWSDVVSATTPEENLDLPEVPFNVQAQALSTTEIRVTWEMPVPSKETGFEIERSHAGPDSGFAKLSPDPGVGLREYSDAALTQNTRYWYRLRAYNDDGYSRWSSVATARTDRDPMSQQLKNAITVKEAMFPGLEHLVPDGSAELQELRELFTDYTRGYDEDPARDLIADWQTGYPDDQAAGAEAFERYAFLEKVMYSGFQDLSYTPPIEGAFGTARQPATAIGMILKDACALGLSWKEERAYLSSEYGDVNAAVEDVLTPVFDGAVLLMQLMGMTIDRSLTDMHGAMIRRKGDVDHVTQNGLLSLVDYWQEYIIGRHYFPATQPLIGTFADRTEQLAVTGTRQSAIAKRNTAIQLVRDQTAALKSAFEPYRNICTGLDGAYAIGQAAKTPREIFLRRLREVRPRMVDGIHNAVAAAELPVERFLYLTSPTRISGLDALPAVLQDAGDAIFDPVNSDPPPLGPSPAGADERADAERSSGFMDQSDMSRMFFERGRPSIVWSAPDAQTGMRRTHVQTEGIESDRVSLLALRDNVVSGNVSYVSENFDSLRRSGQDMIAEVTLLQRPLLGIPPVQMYLQEALRRDYYGVMAGAQLLKTRRAVLSVALAEYAVAPSAERQQALVVEIDSILGPLSGVLDDMSSMITDAGTLITQPAIALTAARAVSDDATGRDRCRIEFSVRNDGGGVANRCSLYFDFPAAGITPSTSAPFDLGSMTPSMAVDRNLTVELEEGVQLIPLTAILEADGRIFIDRRLLPVQHITHVADPAAMPSSCVLHQNYPNPFNPATTIAFTVPREMTVSLVVTDALGREVQRIVDNERRLPGTHAVTFDGGSVPSGVYFYRLESGDGVQLRRMVLMR